MRMLLPGKTIRRRVVQNLREFYDCNDQENYAHHFGVADAMNALSTFYKVPPPIVDLVDSIENGRYLGTTYSTGKIVLVHPDKWKTMKPGKKFRPTRAQWIRTVLHEFQHYLQMAEDERKADLYAARFVTGLQT